MQKSQNSTSSVTAYGLATSSPL